MAQRNDEVEIERKEKRSDSSQVASTFIKYAAYVIIFFGFLWFVAHYILPMF